MPASIELTGDTALAKVLRFLPRKVQRKVITPALRVGAKIINKRTRALAPVGKPRERARIFGTRRQSRGESQKRPGYMKRALTVRVARKSRKGTFAVMSVFDTRRFPDLITRSRAGRRYFYPAAVEYGHKASGRFKHAISPRPHPFIRPAFEASKGQAQRATLRSMKKGIIGAARP